MRIKTIRSFAFAVALVIAAFGFSWVPAAPAGAATTEASIADGRLFRILTPADDAIIRGDRMRVRLALKPNVSLRSAQLNGRRITRLFSPRGSSTRQVAIIRKSEMGRRFSLGRNFLSFVVGRGGSGGKRDFEEVAFTRVHRTPGLIRQFEVSYSRNGGVEVNLLPSTLSARFKVTLNGRNVSKQFRTGTPLRRRVLLGASDGLRHGKNKLVVRAHTHHGQYLKVRRTFKVGDTPTIAGAGPDKVIAAGQAATLKSLRSQKPVGEDGEPAGGNLDFSWTLIRRPNGSEASLSAADTRQPHLQTDLPGTYRAELRTVDPARNGSASTDIVTVVANAQPLPAVSTLATVAGKDGIKVDVTRECEGAVAEGKPPCFYPNNGPESGLQVVILDRRTLEAQSNQTYDPASLGAFASEMKKLQRTVPGKCPVFDTSKLVLLALRTGQPANFDFTNFGEGFSVFNTRAEDGNGAGNKAGCPVVGRRPTGFPFSMIAVPGTLQGRSWTNEGFEIDGPGMSPGEEGSLDGYLKRSSDDPALPAASRSFTFQTSLAFDTRNATGGGRSEFVIGTSAEPVVPAELPANTNGIAVFSFDPVNPEATLTREAFIGQSEAEGELGTGLDWAQLDATLKSIGDRKGIGLTSNGQIGGFSAEPKAASFPAVLEDLELFYGANSDTFARAVNQKDGKGTYSMIAVPPLRGIGGAVFQAGSPMSQGVPDTPGSPADELGVNIGRLTGTIQRANNGRVFPSDGDVSGNEVSVRMLPIVYAPQVDWLLTPEPEVTGASCQETAVAYLATRIDGLFPRGAPIIWRNPNLAACVGRDHNGTGGPRRADTLDSDACAIVDPPATGADGPAVRGASMTLRAAYQSLGTSFSEAQILGITRPADAPFTEADLVCAKNQVIDELSARDQVMSYMDILQKPQQNLQGQTVVNFGQIAENIKTNALAKYTQRLKDNNSSTPSFWTNFAFSASFAVGTMGAFFAPEASTILSAFKFLAAASSSGQSVFNAIDQPPGNPTRDTNQYLLLAAQLDQQAIEIEVQMQQVLSAQQNGVLETMGILLADPHKMAEVNANAKGEWQVTAPALRAAQDAYSYRVIQMAYQAFWPQIYSAYRFSYQSGCQITFPGGSGPGSTPIVYCYEPRNPTIPRGGRVGDWRYLTVRPRINPVSLTEANQVQCAAFAPWFRGALAGNQKNYGDADPGTPAGLGRGNEYHPQASVAAKGSSPDYSVYGMAETANSNKIADIKSVAPFFRQTAGPNPNAAGFYAPLFWQQNMAHTKRVQCREEVLTTVPQLRTGFQVTNTTSGTVPGNNFYSNLTPTDIWPTPPR